MKKARSINDTPLIYSTTIGRARFPEFMQLSFGDKAVLGFDRHGKVLGAIVPMEAIKILAGLDQEVTLQIRERIARSAQDLLAQTPGETSVAAFAKGELKKAPRSLIELSDIEARRKKRAAATAKANKSKRARPAGV